MEPSSRCLLYRPKTRFEIRGPPASHMISPKNHFEDSRPGRSKHEKIEGKENPIRMAAPPPAPTTRFSQSRPRPRRKKRPLACGCSRSLSPGRKFPRVPPWPRGRVAPLWRRNLLQRKLTLASWTSDPAQPHPPSWPCHRRDVVPAPPPAQRASYTERPPINQAEQKTGSGLDAQRPSPGPAEQFPPSLLERIGYWLVRKYLWPVYFPGGPRSFLPRSAPFWLQGTARVINRLIGCPLGFCLSLVSGHRRPAPPPFLNPCDRKRLIFSARRRPAAAGASPSCRCHESVGIMGSHE